MRKLVYLIPALVLAGGTVANLQAAAGPGDIAWIQSYTGTTTGPDSARAIAVDSAGYVAVTGTSEGEGTGMDIATVEYAPNGTQLWAARFNDADTSVDEATDVAIDRNGNVIVVGYGGLFPTDMDYTTIKYSPAGVQQWVARYNSPANNGDYATAAAVDDSGNVYVTGYCLSILGINADYTTIKYNAAGVQQWVATYNGIADGNDYARDIAVDSSGRVYVTGESQNPAGNADFLTIMYNAAGVEQWVARYDGSQNLADKAVRLCLDPLDDVVVTGSTEVADSSSDYVTIKYDGFGNELWRAFYAGPVQGPSLPTDIAISESGAVCVTGASTGANGGLDYATVKYDQDGHEQWVARYSGPGSYDDVPNDIVVDHTGRVYVTGYSTNSSGNRDYATIRYESDGRRGWTAIFDGPAAGNDAAVGIGLDGADNVYVTGTSFASISGDDYLTIKYEANGSAVAEPGAPLKQAGPNLTPSPNPARDRTVVEYIVRRPGPVRLSLYRADGSLADVRELDGDSPGQHAVGLDLRQLRSGTYFMRLDTQSGTSAGKLVIQ